MVDDGGGGSEEEAESFAKEVGIVFEIGRGRELSFLPLGGIFLGRNNWSFGK